jgi:hypothetical protein
VDSTDVNDFTSVFLIGIIIVPFSDILLPSFVPKCLSRPIPVHPSIAVLHRQDQGNCVEQLQRVWGNISLGESLTGHWETTLFHWKSACDAMLRDTKTVAALHQTNVAQDSAAAFQSAHPTLCDARRERYLVWSFCCLHERHRQPISDSSLYGTRGFTTILQDHSAFY